MVDSLAPVRPDKYAVGDVIAGKYRLERLLGEGGQAWVWQARNLALDACVALKVLREDGSNALQIRRLLQEARAAARLGHPAIVRVFDLGEAESGDPFLVMELLEGESLADRLVERGRMSPFEAVRVLLPIADALVAAHAKGIVHRDLKPDNVFLAIGSDSFQPKLLDFGIAAVRRRQRRTVDGHWRRGRQPRLPLARAGTGLGRHRSPGGCLGSIGDALRVFDR